MAMAADEYECLLAQKRDIEVSIATKQARRPYHLVAADGTTCVACGREPRLLATVAPDMSAPAFYVCSCGCVGQVGVGRVPE